MSTTYTPLRYPGGKSSLYPTVSNLIASNNLNGATYVEPFAGGAGLAIKLLLLGEVTSVVLNDLDPAIAAIWRAVINNTDKFTNFVSTVPLTIDQWEKQHHTYAALRNKALNAYESQQADQQTRAQTPLEFLNPTEEFTLACAAFYLNRTNRSGIMAGGPIGGKRQTGKWGIDARFNRENLITKIQNIAARGKNITVYNLDAVDLIQQVIPQLNRASAPVFVYFDPPYVAKGPGLYKNSLEVSDHKNLASLIHACNAYWMVTYDQCALTENLYSNFDPQEISISYCAYKIKQGKEILVLSKQLTQAS